jgi:Flp pilus assembly pilin Flp
VSLSFARTRVDSTSQSNDFHCAQRALEMPKGGESMLSFTDLIHYLRARFQVEEGQTMAEYGVVLAVIALGVVVALGLLSGAISGAIDRVRGFL